MRAQQIVKLAKDIRQNWNTSDPYEIARKFNHFSVTEKNLTTSVEYEADLFALALLLDESQLTIPMDKMSSSTIRYIMNYNIQRGKDIT